MPPPVVDDAPVESGGGDGRDGGKGGGARRWFKRDEKTGADTIDGPFSCPTSLSFSSEG